jgi:large subunit ribosomal protein L7Ae
LFRILEKYSPETRKEKQERLRNTAANGDKKSTPKPVNLKFGLNHVTYLVEQKRAKLVLIASDVDPIETVVFLPTLCKAMGIPYAIVQCKSRLGRLVHKKTASCVALTEFTHSQAELNNIARNCEQQFNSSTTSWRSKIIYKLTFRTRTRK